jgi:hypothetical protein
MDELSITIKMGIQILKQITSIGWEETYRNSIGEVFFRT